MSLGGLPARRGGLVALMGGPPSLSLAMPVDCPKYVMEFGPYTWQMLHCRQGTQAALPWLPAEQVAAAGQMKHVHS